MNLFFPITTIEKPSQEVVHIYAHITGAKSARKILFFTLALCALTIVFTFFSVDLSLLLVIYVCPTLLLAVGAICTVAAVNRLIKFGVLLCLMAMENLCLALAPFPLLYPRQTIAQMLSLYCLFLLCAFVAIIVLYRLRYKKFDNIMQMRIHNKKHPQKRPWAGFLGAVSLVVVVRLIINTFAMWMLGAAGAFLAIYYMSPLIAEQLVIVRQYNQMNPYLQEYAGDENAPET